jgi:hypothetical protein
VSALLHVGVTCHQASNSCIAKVQAESCQLHDVQAEVRQLHDVVRCLCVSALCLPDSVLAVVCWVGVPVAVLPFRCYMVAVMVVELRTAALHQQLLLAGIQQVADTPAAAAGCRLGQTAFCLVLSWLAALPWPATC